MGNIEENTIPFSIQIRMEIIWIPNNWVDKFLDYSATIDAFFDETMFIDKCDPVEGLHILSVELREGFIKLIASSDEDILGILERVMLFIKEELEDIAILANLVFRDEWGELLVALIEGEDMWNTIQ